MNLHDDEGGRGYGRRHYCCDIRATDTEMIEYVVVYTGINEYSRRGII